jgi:hypothetical protein
MKTKVSNASIASNVSIASSQSFVIAFIRYSSSVIIHLLYFIGTGVKERMKIHMAVQPMTLRLRSKGIWSFKVGG